MSLLLQGVPELEALVMENMLFAHKPNLCSVHPQEPQVLFVRDQVAASVTAALVPAHQFLAKLQTYNAWLQLDVPAYITSLEVSRVAASPHAQGQAAEG